MQKTTLTVLLIAAVSSIYGQTLEGGFGLGATQYRGDLNPNFNILTSRPGANLMARYNFSRGFSVRADGMFAFLAGADRLSTNPMNKLRDYSFSGQIMEGDLLLEYNFFNFRSYGTIFKSSWTPTLFGGLGWFSLTKRKYNGNGGTFIPDNITFPDNLLVYGFGLKKELSSNWNFNLNFGARMRMQRNSRDLLDGLGYSYGEQGNKYDNFYPDSNTATPVMLRTANGKTGDRYFYANVTFSYVLYGLKCPNPKK